MKTTPGRSKRSRASNTRASKSTEPVALVDTPIASLSHTGEQLLRMAEDLSRATGSGPTDVEAMLPLSEFIQTYREWISTNRGRLHTQHQQAEQWQLVVYSMITASTIEEAIHRLIRFGKVVWGDRGPSELREEGAMAALVFTEPFHPGKEGLIAEIWPLALTLCELEFLANARFHGACGRVTHSRSLDEGIVALLFSAPLTFGANDVALLLPRHYLRRPVLARSEDLPTFFRQMLPLTLGARREPPSIQALAAGLIRDDKRGPDFRETSFENVALRLGMSAATLRRRLSDELVSYRQIRDSTYNALAQNWLRRQEISIVKIAERLNFSDSFAFRRFFHRMNNESPSAFRARESVTSDFDNVE